MIAHPRLPRDTDSVNERAHAVRAAFIADPAVGYRGLGRRFRLSDRQIKNYLGGRIKAFKEVPAWHPKFFAAASALSQRDHATAARAFRELADQLDQPA